MLQNCAGELEKLQLLEQRIAEKKGWLELGRKKRPRGQQNADKREAAQQNV